MQANLASALYIFNELIFLFNFNIFNKQLGLLVIWSVQLNGFLLIENAFQLLHWSYKSSNSLMYSFHVVLKHLYHHFAIWPTKQIFVCKHPVPMNFIVLRLFNLTSQNRFVFKFIYFRVDCIKQIPTRHYYIHSDVEMTTLFLLFVAHYFISYNYAANVFLAFRTNQ